MREVMLIESVEQAGALLSPLRMEILKLAGEPRTCTEFAESLGESPQKIYYHVKVLERAGAIEKVEERRVRAISEGLYRAAARSYWLSPKLLGQIGGCLAQEGHDGIPSLGFSAQVHLAGPEERAAFLHEVQEAIQSIATKYGAIDLPHREADETPCSFRLILACYPRSEGLGAP